MSFDLHNKSVETTLNSALAGSYPGTMLHFDNVAFAQPEGAWVAVTLIDGKSRQTELGPKVIDRHVGFVQIETLVPELTGTTTCRKMAEFCGNVFRRQTVYLPDGARVIYRIPEYISRGTNKGYYCIMSRIPYWRDEYPA